MSESKPHHAGHRERLRERFIKSPDSLPDYEILELFLFMAIPRRDVKPLAKALLERFKDLNGLIAADISALCDVEGVSENTAIAIKAMQEFALRLKRGDVMNKPLLNSWERLMDYLHVALANEMREQTRVLFMDKRNHLIADEIQQKGTVDRSSLYPREVLKRALDIGATAVVLVHNHPSGDLTPSEDDIAMTHAVHEALAPVDIILHDHLIISRKGYYSFRTNGLIE